MTDSLKSLRYDASVMSAYTKVSSLKAPLKEQLDQLAEMLTSFSKENNQIEGVLLTGSCSRGEATYRSDVDLLFVVRDSSLIKFSEVQKNRDKLENFLNRMGKSTLLNKPLELQSIFVSLDVFETEEPAMSEALSKAIIFVDVSGEIMKALKQREKK